MCEAYVTLGRLSHVKMRHEEDAEKLRALLDERVGGAFESALEKVRGDVSAFWCIFAILSGNCRTVNVVIFIPN